MWLSIPAATSRTTMCIYVYIFFFYCNTSTYRMARRVKATSTIRIIDNAPSNGYTSTFPLLIFFFHNIYIFFSFIHYPIEVMQPEVHKIIDSIFQNTLKKYITLYTFWKYENNWNDKIHSILLIFSFSLRKILIQLL